MNNLHYLYVLLIFSSCMPKQQNPIEIALNSNHPKITKVVSNLKKHELQVLFSEVTESEKGITFTDYSFQVNDSNYFYPASSVKFPIALLALEKLQNHPQLTLKTKFKVEGDTTFTTFEDEINKLFAVSDNHAYNRLFEFLGQDYINTQLKKRGLKARIAHRFSIKNSNRLETRPLYFFENDSLIFTSRSSINRPLQHLNLNTLKKGKGYIENDTLVNLPMDFSLKNYLPLQSLHNMMKQLMFPKAFKEYKQSNLSEEHRNFIIKSMGNLPCEIGFNRQDYYDSYVKFFLFGDSKEPIPKHIKIYNKVGYAFGYLTDCAFIINKKTNKKYIITATIHVNENGIFNDDIYEYETIGIPFLAELGRQLIPINAKN